MMKAGTRRPFLLAAFGPAALLAAACGVAGNGRSAPGAAPAPEGYPRDVADTLGTTRIPAPPARVATIANTYDLDALLALGVAPVHIGIRIGFSQIIGSETRSWPWHEDALAALRPQAEPQRAPTNTNEPPVERIAAARPDLILSPLTGQANPALEQLRQIAPVLTLSPDWRRNLRMVGTALDRVPLAERLVQETDRKIAQTLDGLGLSGPTVTLAYPDANGTVRVPAHPADSRVDLFQRAGFRVSPELTAMATAESPLAIVSTERTSLLEGDLIVVLAYQPAAADAWIASPLARGLAAVRAGRVLWMEQGAVAQGMAFFGPLNADAILPTIRRAGELLKG